ncbi:MAG: DUF2079 domain-containing protein [Rhizonema sp. PD37]|nr:DUF2079 domain-containing protein [Rhizonema sp. PD37]
MIKKIDNINTLSIIIAASTLILFISSSIKHILFKSNALDLGIFDQAVYLISQGQKSIPSLLGFHILGDHAAWIFYPLAVLYKIYPSVYWLFAVQAVALAFGALPIWYLAKQARLKESQALAIATAYLLYPLVFNVNIFDFHPEVIAVPALLVAVLAARSRQIWWFCLSILFVFGCKAVLALTVTAMGVWLLVFEKRRLYGAIAIVSGIVWFAIATKAIIPFFGGAVASVERHIYRYSYLGHSFPEIFKNLLFHPNIILKTAFSLANLEYLTWLILPVIWGFSLLGITPLISTIPCLAINLLADYHAQKDLIHQYSLPVIPFLFLVVINSLAADRGWLKSRRSIILWSLIAFLALAKFSYFGKYLSSLDTWQATTAAITQIHQGSILTTDEIAPHLSHRELLTLVNPESPVVDFTKYDYILLNIRHTLSSRHKQLNISYLNLLKNNPNFKLSLARTDVYLFKRAKLS